MIFMLEATRSAHPASFFVGWVSVSIPTEATRLHRRRYHLEVKDRHHLVRASQVLNGAEFTAQSPSEAAVCTCPTHNWPGFWP